MGSFKRVGETVKTVVEAGDLVGVDVSRYDHRKTRADIAGDRHGKGDASILVDEDGRGGRVFNFKTSEYARWHDDVGRRLSFEERRQRNIEWAVRNATRRETERSETAFYSEVANQIYRSCKKANTHPYLTKKRVKPFMAVGVIDAREVEAINRERGLRGANPCYQINGEWHRMKGELLVIPLQIDGRLMTLEFIDAEGHKYFMKNGRKAGAYWMAHPIEVYQASNRIGIAEGVATALSVDMVKGYPCISAMDCGNLETVAKHWVNKFPEKTFEILSDEGRGEEEAKKAGQAIGAPVVKPIFTEELIKAFQLATGSKDNPTDWNDFYIAIGAL